MHSDTYEHICDAFYNEIEIAMTEKLKVTIYFYNGDDEKNTQGFIEDLYQNENGEFLQLDNSITIRLDKIYKFNNFFPENLTHIHTFGFSEI